MKDREKIHDPCTTAQAFQSQIKTNRKVNPEFGCSR